MVAGEERDSHVAPMLGPSLALRRAAKSQSYRPLLWVAASVWLTAFAAAAWWQYGENDRSPLSSTDRGPSELKIAQLPALTVLRTIDRPDVALFAQGDAPETPTIVALQPSAYAELPALPATGLVGIVQQRPELADVRQVAARAAQRSFRPRSGRSGKTGRRLPSGPWRTRRDSPIRRSTLPARARLKRNLLPPRLPPRTLHRREGSGEIALAAHSLGQAVSRAASVVRSQNCCSATAA